MKYIALLRGINVGGNHKVEMKKLKELFSSAGFDNISTYINSGNIIFESDNNTSEVYKTISLIFQKEFDFEIPTIIKTQEEMKLIANSIPSNWKNDTEQKTDVAYLFEKIDSEKITTDLPLKLEFIDIRYVKGALIWNVLRKNYNKSHLNKIISHKYYKLMTIRNVNTARYLANS